MVKNCLSISDLRTNPKIGKIFVFQNHFLCLCRLSQNGSESGVEERSPGNEKDVKWQELKSSKLKYLDKMFDSVLHNSDQ